MTVLQSDHSARYTLEAVGELRPSTRDWLIRQHIAEGEWWHAASLIAATHTLKAYELSAPSWIAWLRGIPLSKAHASKLVTIHHAGLATPSLSLRVAYSLAAGVKP